MAAAKSAQRKRDLLEATTRIIGERGLAAVSVRAIAEQADVSAGSVLYHFESIDQLVEAAVQGTIAEFIDSRRRLSEGYRDPVARLRATIEAGIPAHISADLRILYEASAVVREQAKFRLGMTLLLERQVGLYATIIEVGAASGVFRPRMDVTTIAENLVALEDAYDLYLLDPENWQRERYLQNTYRFAELALDCDLGSEDA
ncbi:TetR family transcriptional regulator [Pseudoclavibacter chungangensis]|uniref:TetR family transcriptional regulator n=1 Tax=Pseudoclavibacter chungangensis TaxID=587635 RepID=A0A7J5BTI9_9MICO|nr:TetR/AcrR family transcriptional regulator [Pseudoclavibacter chungangensis]KAB1653405.1 TetR family transcriptional regulator [Pseudoclavibacter chungangensis]KAB1657231.1 TetR family transcriptional regulator [Pseudoclavibacter chungangensis]NYJ66334.1 AcrR family transcriptional regulator [Pseudoclavibacter chungangensis]